MGDIYTVSQAYKPKIESSPDLMRVLIQYCHEPHSLHFLGEGISNIHYRVGQLESGLWLATRENIIFLDNPLQRIVAENYSNSLEVYSQRGNRTSRISIGVKYHSNNPERYEDRYFLILEDFTQGGRTSFEPGKSEQEFGMIKGEKVYYDFDDSTYEVGFKFMSDSSIIHIR